MEERDPSVIGNLPGQVYGGGPQTQKQGLRGRTSEALMKRWDHLFRGKNPAMCGPINTHECADIISRLLEQTFRNFQLTARPPSHLAPPFSAKGIDTLQFLPINIVNIFFPIATFTMPTGNYRGVIATFGQDAENAAAFLDLNWRITINGQPVRPYQLFNLQFQSITNPARLCTPIQLRGGDVVSLEASMIAGPGPHFLFARLCGWFYPVRVEMDNQIGSTLVD